MVLQLGKLILDNEIQPSKAVFPTHSQAGADTLVRAEQKLNPLNHLTFGKLTVERLVHDIKVSSKYWLYKGKDTLVKAVHPAKADSPIGSINSVGIFIVVKAVQPANAILSTTAQSVSVTIVKFEQSLNALAPTIFADSLSTGTVEIVELRNS